MKVFDKWGGRGGGHGFLQLVICPWPPAGLRPVSDHTLCHVYVYVCVCLQRGKGKEKEMWQSEEANSHVHDRAVVQAELVTLRSKALLKTTKKKANCILWLLLLYGS